MSKETINGRTLDEWINEVDEIVRHDERYQGLGVYEILGDFCSYDAWSDECEPREYFLDVLQYDLDEEIHNMTAVMDAMGW